MAPGGSSPAILVLNNVKINKPSPCEDEPSCLGEDGKSETSSKKRVGGKKDKSEGVDRRSDYEQERDENIARNKKVLAKLNEEWKERLAKSSKDKTRTMGELSGTPSRFVDLFCHRQHFSPLT